MHCGFVLPSTIMLFVLRPRLSYMVPDAQSLMGILTTCNGHHL